MGLSFRNRELTFSVPQGIGGYPTHLNANSTSFCKCWLFAPRFKQEAHSKVPEAFYFTGLSPYQMPLPSVEQADIWQRGEP